MAKWTSTSITLSQQTMLFIGILKCTVRIWISPQASIGAPDAQHVVKLARQQLVIGRLLQNVPQYLDGTKQQLSAGIVVHQPTTQPASTVGFQHSIAVFHWTQENIPLHALKFCHKWLDTGQQEGHLACKETNCCYPAGGNLTRALHVLELQLEPSPAPSAKHWTVWQFWNWLIQACPEILAVIWE